MFNLEQSIAEWRRQMLAAGIKTPVPLEELEIHLREEIERQMKVELNSQRAFENAVQKIGRPESLKTEFEKTERNVMTKIAIILLGIFGVLFGAAMILPALARHNHLGVWHDDMVWPIVAGGIIALAGTSIAAFGFKKRKV